MSSDTAEKFFASACKNQQASIASTFASQRAEINKQLYSGGGSPVNYVVEEEIKTARGIFGIASGKAVLKGLCQVSMGIKFDAISLIRSRVACEIADDLRLLLTDILEQT